MAGSSVAPSGSPCAEKVSVSPVSGSLPPIVKCSVSPSDDLVVREREHRHAVDVRHADVHLERVGERRRRRSP